MATRLKEDEKNERIIRSLLKQPTNRKCINCNSLGPQYVCTTFWTFVCTTCSGIHREFSHRVKSVSMAKFTLEEVSSLQSGGNERAKEIYFKELDSHRLPDSSNLDKLRDFIKHVYVNRRYTGERSNDRPSRVKMEEQVDYKKTDSYRNGSRSPPYEDAYERRPSPGYEGRSPAYEQDNQRNSDYGRSPVRFGSGVVNDWRQEDRFGNGRRSEDLRSSEGDSKSGGRSPDSQKDLNASSPSAIRPVRDILAENAAPLRVIEPPRVSSGKMCEDSVHTQRTASSSSLASSNGNLSKIKREDSLINFDDDPEPPAAAATQPTQSAANLASTANGENWACFDNAQETRVSQPPANVNPLDSVLTQLSAPSAVPASGVPTYGGAPAASLVNSATTAMVLGDSLFAPAAQVSVTPSNGTTPPASNASLFTDNGAYAATSNNTTLPTNSAGTSVGNFSSFPSGGAPPAVTGLTSTMPANGIAGQWSNMQPSHQSVYPGSGSHPTASQFTSSLTVASGSQGFSSRPVIQVSQAGVVPAQASSEITAQPLEVKTSGRKELPVDLFTAMYAPQPVHATGWMTGFAPGMAFPMQYNTAMPMPTFPQSTKSSNPFDISSESSRAQTPAFPSMTPLQTALLDVANPTGLVHMSSLDTVRPSWMPSQESPYTSVTPQLTPSFAPTAVTPGTYMSQEVPSNLALSPQGFGVFGNNASSFISLNSTLDLGRGLSAPAAPNPSGNPFG